MSIFIGGAWPYANGSLHLGHVAGLLPGDILARYYRAKGEEVLYVSGSDCNGTPIAIRAKQEGVEVNEIANRYHDEFEKCFQNLGFSYNLYTRTDTEEHHKTVQSLFVKLYENNWLYEKEVDQVFCESCDQFLPDRYVEGECPVCGAHSRGDQCDSCSTVLDAIDLKSKTCITCKQSPIIQSTKHLYFSLSKLQDPIEKFFKENKHRWRENAVLLTKRYLEEGLRDRAVTRDLPNGIAVPVEGYTDKKIYVWIEAVSGYYSAAVKWGEIHQRDICEYWEQETTSYYVHGKDNIPFHTIIWPAILIASGITATPNVIVSSEYLTLEKRKFSTSQNWAIWLPELLETYHPDTIRYFLTINSPETKDTNFSWREFIYSYNTELLGAFGNLAQRTLKFYHKEFGNVVEPFGIDEQIREKVTGLYEAAGNQLEKGNVKRALESIFEFVRWSNKYFDEQKPWNVINEDREQARTILSQFLYILGNLSSLLHPFVPFTVETLREQLGLDNCYQWKEVLAPTLLQSNTFKPLFTRIDIKEIEKERAKLGIV